MSSIRLIEHFSRFSDAPNAVSRLRRFVLELAVRGRLVEQDPADELADELLEQLRQAQANDPKRSKTALQQQLFTISETERPYEVPPGWGWIRIGAATYVEMGQSPPSEHYNQDGNGMPFFQGKADFGPRYPTPRYWCTEPKKTAKPGDILISVRAPVGPTNVANQLCCIGRGLAALRPHEQMNSEYLLRCLEAFRPSLESLGFGTTFVAINKKQLVTFPLPLPPLAEQHRIVAKVDELMGLCDQLEFAQNEREARRDRLVAASLHRIRSPKRTGTEGASGDESSSATKFLENLPKLTTRPEHIQQFRATILDLAVHGRLVSQNPTDEPAASALERNDLVREETAKNDRRAKKDKQDLLQGEQRWAIPVAWAWRGLADIALFIDYRGKTPKKTDAGVRLITAKNVRGGFVSLEPAEYISENEYGSWMTRGIPESGDVLFTTEAPMGNAAVVNISEKFGLAQRVINFRLYGAITAQFLVIQLMSPAFRKILADTATGLTAKGIKAAKLKRLPIAIPPLAEQQRIVAKVERLFALCDQLEANLTITQRDAINFVEAVLQEAV